MLFKVEGRSGAHKPVLLEAFSTYAEAHRWAKRYSASENAGGHELIVVSRDGLDLLCLHNVPMEG
jgi:hypothetical protein